ncbi:Sds3-like-domain-containing protein [Bisporella sp. PMI_857]|nr:Sds3-like-domain-containing protein [Bisporella sp. PMI_857]
MATSPSPPRSPTMGGSHRVDRHHTNSPPPISKRDKRRTMLADRLEELITRFSQSKDIHYREQLQAIQIDMNLIMEADAYGQRPLKDQGEDIDDMVLDSIKNMRTVLAPPPRAGKLYADFANQVNDAMEDRDRELTLHRRDYEVKMSELNATHAYRMRLAANEHSALSSTLRDRLINSVISKKNRLSRDRETVEIADSNAFLLHPSQYGLANPASPGGLHGKRATRHRRDAEELATLAEGGKRKRKAADSDESPAPTRQRLDNGASTPLWAQEKRDLTSQQVDSNLYSIDKLFTEKELAMTYNTAALAAHSYIQRHQPYSDNVDSPPNGKADSSNDDIAANGDMDDDEESAPGGVSMERQYSHATRSTRAVAPNYVTGLGIDVISDLNYPGNMLSLNKQLPKLPPLLASVMQRGYIKGDSANQPNGLTPEELASELEIIRQARRYNDQHGKGQNLELENGGRTLLEAVATPRRYQIYYMKSENKGYIGSNTRESNLRESSIRGSVRDGFATPLGGDDMSRVPSEVGGGIPMSRQDTGEGVTSSRGRKLR